jgi:hypothetical protein
MAEGQWLAKELVQISAIRVSFPVRISEFAVKRSALVRRPIQAGSWLDQKTTRIQPKFSTAKYSKHANKTDEISTANGHEWTRI